ncbi:lipopolysaccharide biosynthesis protein [Rhizobium bangladeshense]|uniref:lipopolysaccharide biosynthesis protein n=1 Tax=Rhizobium bangladeshense TaxID=1138189 RepID=UPI001C83EC39|nr:oligosaccharide flippase family protein [Rhizobium bangladeshense]MBX4893856.1 oligosaccharide flippase family protein [Rhizobium bangladeshense]MBX4917954.1 oligosaccharide flippase family protein [Rhizobium bangladeshense]
MSSEQLTVREKVCRSLARLGRGDDSSVIISNGLQFALASVLAQLFPLLSVPLMLRTLTAQEWGFYTILVQTGSLMQVLGTTLFSQSLLRFYAATNESDRHKLIWTSVLAGTVSQTALLGLLWIFRHSTIRAIFPNVDIPIDPAFTWAIFWWLFATFRTLLMTVAKVQEKPWQVLQLTGLYGIILLPGLTLVVSADLGLIGALQALIAAELVGAVVNLLLTSREFKISFDLESLRRGVCFSLPLLPSSLMTSLLLNADRIVLSRFANLSLQGHYALGSMVGSGMAVIVTSFWSSYSARVLSVKSSRGIRSAAQTGKETMHLGVKIVGLPVIGLCLLGWPLFHLITNDHAQLAIAAVASIGVATGHFCRFLTLPAQHSLFMQSRTITMLSLSACTLVVMFIASFGLTFVLGPIAVAFAFGTAHILMAVPYYKTAGFGTNVDLSQSAVLYGGLIIAAAIAAAVLLSSF